MQFLAPLFLVALTALALPILLHVRRQKPKERVRFSAVHFLDSAAPRTRRRLRIEDLLLLVLRCLGLALLVLAFARPFFMNETLFASTVSTHRLLLVDTSASMRDGRLDRARNEAIRLLDQLPSDDLIAVASFDATLTVHLSFDALQAMSSGERRTAARQALESLQSGWHATNLDTALITAADIVDRARDSGTGPATIHVVSDFQRGAQTDSLSDYDWPERITVQPVRIADEEWTNAGIHPVTATAVSFTSPRATISNSSGSMNDAFSVERKGGDSAAVTVAPGMSETIVLDGLQPPGEVTLTGDPFEFDNRAWFAPLARRTLAVNYFGNADPDDPKDTLFFLIRALQPTAEYEIDLRVRPETIRDADLTILDGSLDAAQWNALRQQLATGQNALLVLRDAGDAALLGALAGVDARAEEIAPEDPAIFGQINFDHPVLEPFADPAYSNFSRIHTWRYRQLNAAALSRLDPIIRFASGDPALLHLPVEKGNLFVLTTSWTPADSQLALSSKFVPLLHSLLAQSSTADAVQTQAQIGEPVRIPPGVATSVRVPGGEIVEAEAGVFRATDAPGIYRTTDDAFVFAVNPSPFESELTPLTDVQLAALHIPIGSTDEAIASEAQRQTLAREELERRQKWWWWLILFAIAAFVAETLLAGRATRLRVPQATP